MAEDPFSTLAVYAGEEPDTVTGALTPAIQMSAASKLPGFGPRLLDALTVDSSWATPCLQRPLDLGADYVLHSATMYLCGHGAALGRLLAGRAGPIHRLRTDALPLMVPSNAGSVGPEQLAPPDSRPSITRKAGRRARSRPIRPVRLALRRCPCPLTWCTAWAIIVT